MIDNSVLKRLAIQQFGTVLVQGKEYFELDEADLQAFAQAVIEDYKAGLVPVQDYKQRILTEKKDLDKKADALSQFISLNTRFTALAEAEQVRMKEQNDIMWQYSEILGERIAALKETR